MVFPKTMLIALLCMVVAIALADEHSKHHGSKHRSLVKAHGSSRASISSYLTYTCTDNCGGTTGGPATATGSPVVTGGITTGGSVVVTTAGSAATTLLPVVTTPVLTSGPATTFTQIVDPTVTFRTSPSALTSTAIMDHTVTTPATTPAVTLTPIMNHTTIIVGMWDATTDFTTPTVTVFGDTTLVVTTPAVTDSTTPVVTTMDHTTFNVPVVNLSTMIFTTPAETTLGLISPAVTTPGLTTPAVTTPGVISPVPTVPTPAPGTCPNTACIEARHRALLKKFAAVIAVTHNFRPGKFIAEIDGAIIEALSALPDDLSTPRGTFVASIRVLLGISANTNVSAAINAVVAYIKNNYGILQLLGPVQISTVLRDVLNGSITLSAAVKLILEENASGNVNIDVSGAGQVVAVLLLNAGANVSGRSNAEIQALLQAGLGANAAQVYQLYLILDVLGTGNVGASGITTGSAALWSSISSGGLFASFGGSFGFSFGFSIGSSRHRSHVKSHEAGHFSHVRSFLAHHGHAEDKHSHHAKSHGHPQGVHHSKEHDETHHSKHHDGAQNKHHSKHHNDAHNKHHGKHHDDTHNKHHDDAHNKHHNKKHTDTHSEHHNKHHSKSHEQHE